MLRKIVDGFAALAGRVLQGVFAAIMLVRRPRPIHSRGVILTGRMTWLGTSAPSGISWIDGAPSAGTTVTARVSRSVGLPAPLPDVIGLAMRMPTADGFADLELASTGIGVPGRFVLVPHRTPSRATFGSLFPYRGTSGPVLVCARPVSPTLPPDLAGIRDALTRESWRLRLYFTTPTSRWRVFAEVALHTAPDDDFLRFDALRHPLPGAGSYRWERLARQPSYRLAQGG
jgi:hypothetical protein